MKGELPSKALRLFPRLGILALGASAGGAMGADVAPWKPVGIASPLFESHPAFDPRTGDFYFVRSSKSFQGWRILVSHCTDKGWSEPKPPSLRETEWKPTPGSPRMARACISYPPGRATA